MGVYLKEVNKKSLTHYGVLGMKWGVRKDKGEKKPKKPKKQLTPWQKQRRALALGYAIKAGIVIGQIVYKNRQLIKRVAQAVGIHLARMGSEKIMNSNMQRVASLGASRLKDILDLGVLGSARNVAAGVHYVPGLSR